MATSLHRGHNCLLSSSFVHMSSTICSLGIVRNSNQFTEYWIRAPHQVRVLVMVSAEQYCMLTILEPWSNSSLVATGFKERVEYWGVWWHVLLKDQFTLRPTGGERGQLKVIDAIIAPGYHSSVIPVQWVVNDAGISDILYLTFTSASHGLFQ